MRWTSGQTKIAIDRLAESMREAGLLWFVFSLLDKLVAGQLTIPWVAGNAAGSIAAIMVGTYIEMKTCRTNTSQPSPS